MFAVVNSEMLCNFIYVLRVFFCKRCCCLFTCQVTLSIELNDSQLIEFERIIPVELAQPPWNYTLALSKGLMVHIQQLYKPTNGQSNTDLLYLDYFL